MRICLISREFPPDSGWGGIGTYTYKHAHSLKQLGHDVEVIALSGTEPGRDRVGKMDEGGITVHRVASAKSLPDLEMVQLSTPFTFYVLRNAVALAETFFRVHRERPFDVAEAPEHLAEGLCPALTRLVPLVVRLHTPQSKLIEERFHNLTPSFDQEFVAMIERIGMLSADEITSPSEDMADYVAADMGYPRNEIRIIRNTVDVDQFKPEGKTVLPEVSQLKVLFVGRLEERKGIHYLIEAVPKVVERCSNVQFIVIGADTNNAAGQKSTLAELQEHVQDSGSSERVTFIPSVPLAEISDYYRTADICVLPSLYDNAPCTVIEAMSSGKPVVTTTAGGSKEYVQDGQSGIVVPPKDCAALADAIVKLLLDQSLRSSMGKSARDRVLIEFHPIKMAEQTVEVYQRAITKHAKRTSHAAYSRPAERFLADCNNLLRSYDRMLYDFLYANSRTFRMKHRLNKAFNILSARRQL